MTPGGRGRRIIAPLMLGAVFSVLALIALVAMTLATSGVFAARPGDWTVRIGVAPYAAFDVNVTGLVKFATSPLGLRLLDGRSRTTSLGQLRLRRADDMLIVRCAPCRLNDARLHTQTIVLDAVELRLARRDSVIDGTIASGGVEVPFTATLRADGIDIDWRASTDIVAIYRVLGHAIAEAGWAQIEGRISARGKFTLPARSASTQVTLDGFAVDGLGTERLQHGRFEFNCGTGMALRKVTTGDGEKGWTPLDKLGALLPAAVLAAEDQRFMTHAGFDPEEISQALAATSKRSPARGASTITQQLARRLFTGAERTAVRKLRELLYAVEMERTLGKPRILELYLNSVDWGPGVCGARAAAQTYFRKPPAQLTPIEAAWLAGILRNPHVAHSEQFVPQAPDRERANWVLMQMRSMPRAARHRAAKQALVFAPAIHSTTAHVPQLAHSRTR